MSMESSDLELLAKSILGYEFFVDAAELDFASKWMKRGPLSVPTDRRVSGTESLISSLGDGHDLVSIQSIAHRLSKKFARANDLIFFLIQTSRTKVQQTPLSVPIISLNKLAASLLPAQPATTQAWSESESLLFGETACEQNFVRDLIFVIQGIDGQLVRFTSAHKIKILSSSLISPSHSEELIRNVGEHGTLVRSISELFVGRERSAFQQAVEIELNKFKSVAAVIESDITNWTLIRMMAFLTVPIRKLRFLGNTVVECLNKSILDTLFEKLQRGVFLDIIDRLWAAMVKQWLHRVELWVMKGELIDDEIFFVTETTEKSWQQVSVNGPKNLAALVDSISKSGNYIWTRKYLVVDELVPKFVPKKTAMKILAAGKSMALLRTEKSPLVPRIAPLAGFQDWKYLEADVKTCSTNSLVLDWVVEQHNLVSHLRAIKEIFLMGQGEVFERFVGNSMLLKPDLTKFDVMHVFDSAVEGLGIENLDRIEIGLTDIRGATVYESIHLDYVATSPIDVVLDPDTVRKYSECFGFLFAMFRLDFGLRQSWRTLMSLDRRLSNGVVYLAGVDLVIRDMNYLRSKLWTWVNELRFILMVDVVELEWRKLLTGMRDCGTLDNLVAVHLEFVRKIQCGMFLNLENHELKDIVHDAFDVIRRFLNCEAAIHAELGSCLQTDKDIIEFRQRNIIALVRDISDSFDEIKRIFENAIRNPITSSKKQINDFLRNRMISRLCDELT
jgi:gamma-tubulin complex component 3